MTKKWGILALVLFSVYALGMYIYIFHSGSGEIPNALKGTVADPATFMTKQELSLSEEYSKIRNFLFFVITPFEWLIYFFILITGLSRMFENWLPFSNRWAILQNAVYIFLLSFLTFILIFPFNYYQYTLSKHYGISTQPFDSWMRDNITDFWVNFVMTVIIISVLYWIIKRSPKKWWLYAWILTIPYTIFMMFIQPVVLDPLYNDFYPLKNKELEEKILTLAAEANIPADHVYEVNMAEKTNSINAYVTGIGSNSRIVLWDTTLNRLSENEILFIMAHEMAHYVKKDVYINIGLYLLISFLGFWLIAKMMSRLVTRYGRILKINKLNHIHSLPLFFLLVSILLFAYNPVSNIISRYQETRADDYAIQLTGNQQAGITTFQETSKSNLSEANPPLLVKWFRYSHPATVDRIHHIENETE